MIKKSKYKGVSWHAKNGKWQARTNIEDKTVYIGQFDNDYTAYKEILKFKLKSNAVKLEPIFNYQKDTVLIPLSCNNFKYRKNYGKYWAIIDIDEFTKIRKYSWAVAQQTKARLYVVSQSNGKRISMHHINGNPLDNRKINLRYCNNRENQLNTRKHAKNCTSQFKGVTKVKQGFTVRLNMGTFKDEKEAARKYDEIARKIYGEYARLNFPEKGEQNALT